MEQESCMNRAGEPVYARVHILDNPYSIDGAFHYYVPPYLTGAVIPGVFVTVPFGRGNRKQLGVVVAVEDATALPRDLTPEQIKPLESVCRGDVSLSAGQLALCHYLKETTLCTVGEAVRTLMPASALASLVEYYRPSADGVGHERRGRLSVAELQVLEYVTSRGSVSQQTLRTRFGGQAVEAIKHLCDQGFMDRELAVREPRIPTVIYCRAAVSKEEMQAALSGERSSVRVNSLTQKKILEEILAARDTALTVHELKERTGAGMTQIKALSDKGLITTEERVGSTGGEEDEGVRTPQILSPEQENAVRILKELAATGEPKAALLHGVTGSGKTCVILEMIDAMQDSGKGSIVLLPEIGLTPQMLRIFHGRYGSRVAVIHSGLSAGERLAAYRRIRGGQATIVVGTRSAVFAPVVNLGLLVMDEEQEHTYKSDQDPKYHARDIARFRCATENALMLLSSATPSVESYQKAMEGKYTLITMKHRFGKATLPAVRIVDMRGESLQGNLSPLGEELMENLCRVREEGHQSVLFLNRRGYSHQMVCRSCGKAVTCSRCSVAMNYHLRRGNGAGEMVCHWCGERRGVPTTCPDCGSVHLVRMGYGTQRVEEELKQSLPSAFVMRMDADTTTTKTAYHDILEAFRDGGGDILLGTQMVTKGHDFPKVTLVGVLMADMSLYLDDYRASERTFSMLTQVIGRAGRGDDPGLAIIQTMNPDNDIIRLACAQDYEGFFKNEIRLRRLLQFPPFCDMVLLTVTCPNEKELQKACVRLSEELKAKNQTEYRDVPIIAFGPFEAPVYRVDNVYRMRMVVKCKLTRRARALFAELLRAFTTDTRGSQKPVLSIDLNPSGI